MKQKCTIQAFLVGFADWMRDQRSVPLKQVGAEVYKSSGGFTKWAIAFIIFAECCYGSIRAIEYAANHQSFRGISSASALQFMTFAMNIVVPSFLFFYALRIVNRTRHFCGQMCERGTRILTARAQRAARV